MPSPAGRGKWRGGDKEGLGWTAPRRAHKWCGTVSQMRSERNPQLRLLHQNRRFACVLWREIGAALTHSHCPKAGRRSGTLERRRRDLALSSRTLIMVTCLSGVRHHWRSSERSPASFGSIAALSRALHGTARTRLLRGFVSAFLHRGTAGSRAVSASRHRGTAGSRAHAWTDADYTTPCTCNLQGHADTFGAVPERQEDCATRGTVALSPDSSAGELVLVPLKAPVVPSSVVISFLETLSWRWSLQAGGHSSFVAAHS